MGHQRVPETSRGLRADSGVVVLKTSSSAAKCRKATRKLKRVAPAAKKGKILRMFSSLQMSSDSNSRALRAEGILSPHTRHLKGAISNKSGLTSSTSKIESWHNRHTAGPTLHTGDAPSNQPKVAGVFP